MCDENLSRKIDLITRPGLNLLRKAFFGRHRSVRRADRLHTIAEATGQGQEPNRVLAQILIKDRRHVTQPNKNLWRLHGEYFHCDPTSNDEDSL